MEHDDLGETSKKKSPDICDNDRPLKKARYLWQVKGKYHLKGSNASPDGTDSETKDTDSPMEQMDCKTEDSDLNDNNVHTSCAVNMNNNVAQTRNNNLCSDRSCIEALIANSDKIMDFPEPESPHKNIDKSISDEIPVTLVKPNPKNEDYYLRKWQARQIAKGFVDNTINRVLESWMVAPFDAADFVENCDNGGQVEDEGILMAIQSHGLQSGTRELNQRITSNNRMDESSSSLNCKASHVGTRKAWDAVSSCTCTKTRTEVVQNNTLMPFHRRTDNDNITLEYYENLCVLKNTEPVTSNFLVHSTTNLFSAKASSAEDSIEIESSLLTDETEHETMADASDYDSLKMNDTDFLDAAVAVAIQKKGLTSYNCVDCG